MGARARGIAAVVAAIGLMVGPLSAPAAAAGWSVVTSPANSPGSALTGVSCTSAAFCVATGFPTGTTSTLIEQWNGSAWSIVPSPNNDPHNPSFNRLNAVSCVSSVFCFAVGYDGNLTGQALIEEWDGTSWTIVPSNAPEAFDQLWGVSCVSVSFCIAVGDGGSGGDLILQWNGTAWSQVTAPAPPAGTTAFLQGNVSCFSATACMAVGFTIDATTRAQSGFTAAWDGTSWTAVPIAVMTGFVGVQLLGVSCGAANACTAVGTWQNASGASFPLIEQWNGTAWSVASFPLPAGAQQTTLAGASCTGPTSCIVAGDFNDANNNDDTLIESWDGATWSVVPTPNPGANQAFTGVSCAGSTCAAVGSFAPTTHFQTLIEMTAGGGPPVTTCNPGNYCVSGSHTGSIVIPSGAHAVINNATINGAISGSNAASVVICNSSISGSVTISGTSGFVLLGGDGDDAGCGPNTFGSSVSSSSNHGDVEVIGNTLTGSLIVNGTTGSGPGADDTRAEIESNHIGGSLSCSGNSPAPSNDGNANPTTGARSGQCTGF